MGLLFDSDSSDDKLPRLNMGFLVSRLGLEPDKDEGLMKALEGFVFSGLILSGFINRLAGGDRIPSGLGLVLNGLNDLRESSSSLRKPFVSNRYGERGA